ncbi:MAG TPA: NfeD family protein [Rudaea sp.]|nr:NfeD family protein [Rudaea sp.]
MEHYLVWLLIGMTLVIVELLTGTFYLLVLGIACFGGSASAFFGHTFGTQAIVAGCVAALGVVLVHAYRARNAARQMAPIDAGMPANFESWIDKSAGLARVRYRGAAWDARIEESASLEPGSLVYVVAANGNTLKVTVKRPA